MNGAGGAGGAAGAGAAPGAGAGAGGGLTIAPSLATYARCNDRRLASGVVACTVFQTYCLTSAMYSATGYALIASNFSISASRPSRALLIRLLSTFAWRAGKGLGPISAAIAGGCSQSGVANTYSFRNASACFCLALGTTLNTAPA